MVNLLLKIFKYSIAAGIIIYLIISLPYFIQKKEATTCNQLQIEIIDSTARKMVSADQLRQQVLQKGLNPCGKKLSSINGLALETAISSNMAVKEVICTKKNNGDVMLKVWQRKPVLRAFTANGWIYLDEESKPIPALLEYSTLVPVITGSWTPEMLQKEIFQFVSDLQEDSFWKSNIQQIHVRKDRQIELIPRVGNFVIELGALSEYQKKLDNLKYFYQNIIPQVGWNRYSVIKMQYDGQIVCKKRTTESVS